MIIFEATAAGVDMRDARFSTQFRYLRERSTGYTLPAGQTNGANVQTAGHNGGTSARASIYWRYQCGSYVVEKARQPTWVNNVGTTLSQSLTAPTVTGSSNIVDAP